MPDTIPDMQRSKNFAPAMIVVGFLCTVLGVYVTGYLSCETGGWGSISYRQVDKEWQATMYAPAAWVESQLRGHEVFMLDLETRLGRDFSFDSSTEETGAPQDESADQ